MTQLPFPPATIIDNTSDLRTLVNTLQHYSLIAVDTESNGLHAYRQRVCLIQLSTRMTDYIIDPLVMDDISPLGELLANPNIETIFHAAEYDLMCLKRDFGFTVANIFDTMLAARIVGRQAFGLGTMLYEHAGVEPDKSHQRDDWGKRPLPAENLLYAQMDTHYLPSLRDALRVELETIGRLEEAQEAFDDLRRVPPASNEFNPEGYWNIGRPNKLNRHEMGILRELYLLRERIAQQEDTPVFKVMTNNTLVAIVRALPQSHKDLFTVSGLPAPQARLYGDDILEAVRVGLHSKLPKPPPRPRPPAPSIVERYTALHEWRKARGVARGVDSDVILPKDTLWAIARENPDSLDDMQDIRGLGTWRLATYGDEILGVLRMNGTENLE